MCQSANTINAAHAASINPGARSGQTSVLQLPLSNRDVEAGRAGLPEQVIAGLLRLAP